MTLYHSYASNPINRKNNIGEMQAELCTTLKLRTSTALLSTLWHDRVNADFGIICGAHRLKVHKLLLRNYSDALVRVADNKLFKEGESGQLILHLNPYQKKDHDPNEGDDPEMVRETIHFFYHLEFSDINKIKTTPKACDLLFLARMWTIAINTSSTN
ncbi:hypothetical protein QM012_001289 [Aureobasidium pullulans]|uniref:BTB domain-containing protein n=1 Tax=Aureobasidium pullulans TaxID=5580 RepID=A0ABR0TDM3_AURPU